MSQIWGQPVEIELFLQGRGASLEEGWGIQCLHAQGTQVFAHVDGSAPGYPRLAGFGGLCHDSSGRWLLGFYRDVGVVDNLKAELLAILHKLEVAYIYNFRHILCVSDSLHAVYLVCGRINVCHRYAWILARIHDYL
ncbi:hypothetical protein VNO78_01968 [Psophocarpus tetragonolobus]|uniref:RNase H type-1 domain-containing protein n=1 Tax=Psophocarpus tetragonolobus TaxID=3891 RepID=A0AAN9T008_PSOTE